MTLVRIYDIDAEKNKGLFSFFPVHTTSFTRENHMVSSDNKGFAEYILENDNPDLVAAFFQTEAGDVSPNMRDAAHSTENYPEFEGEGNDFVEACENLGRKQAEVARPLLALGATPGNNERQLKPEFDGRLIYANFSGFSFKDENSEESFRTCSPMTGISLFAGTEDGRGIPCIREGWNNETVARSYLNIGCWRVSRYILNILGRFPLFGRSQPFDFPLTSNLRYEDSSQLIQYKNFMMRAVFNLFPEPDEDLKTCQFPKVPGVVSAFESYVFIPIVLPVQVLKLGDLFLPAIPFEITSMAGDRIRRALLSLTPQESVVEILALSNGYVQYMTTAEEFVKQHYEGASTQFGPNQLNASIYLFSELAKAIQLGNASSIGTHYEEIEFKKAVSRAHPLEEFDDGNTTMSFDKVMHHWNSWLELSSLPWSASLFPPGTIYKDVPISALDLTLKSQENKLSAQFYCVFPANSQSLLDSFCDIEKKMPSGKYQVFLRDNDWNVRFIHRRKLLVFDICTCEWIVHNSAEFHVIEPGEYRFRLNGAYENGENSENIELFSGVSSSFSILNSLDLEKLGRVSGNNLIDGYLVYTRDEVLLVFTVFVLFAGFRLFGCVMKPYRK